MDGNRRWAKKRGLPVAAGHRQGADTLVNIAKAAKKIGIKYMTVYSVIKTVYLFYRTNIRSKDHTS